MANTPKRMVGPKQLAGSATTEYTAPAGGSGVVTAVIRMVRFSNPTATDRTVTVSVGADAAGVRFYDAYTIPANSIFSEPLNIPLTNAEVVQMSCSAATAVVVILSGYEVS